MLPRPVVDSTRPAIIASTHESAAIDGGQTARVETDGDLLASKLGMDETEREAIRAEGLDPDDPAVVTAIDLVR